MAFCPSGRSSASRTAACVQAYCQLSARLLRAKRQQLDSRQNFRTVLRDSDGVFEMGGRSSVGSDYGPAVFEDFHLLASEVDHRLNRQYEPRLDLWSLTILNIIQHGRVFVKRAADAMTAKFTNDTVIVGFS